MKKQSVVKDRTYRLKGRKAPISFILNSRNSRRKPLLHFDGQSNRALRYSTNQQSPFEDEQDSNAIIEPIVFEDTIYPYVPQLLSKVEEYHAHFEDESIAHQIANAGA